jgi:hypothetical protein
MTPKDIFGVLVRLVGLLLLLYGIKTLVLFFQVESAVEAVGDGSGAKLALLAIALLALVIGAYLLGGAPSVMSYSYPESPRRAS